MRIVEIGKLVEILKLKLTHLIAVTLALTAFLFLPVGLAQQLGIDTLRTTYRSWAGGALLLFGALVSANIISKLGSMFIGICSAWKQRRSIISRLESLSPEEKQILVGYILCDQKTQYFSPQDGVANGLRGTGLLYMPNSVGNLYGRGFAYNIMPFAWNYLKKHPELITEGAPTDEEGNFVLRRNRDNLLREN